MAVPKKQSFLKKKNLKKINFLKNYKKNKNILYKYNSKIELKKITIIV